MNRSGLAFVHFMENVQTEIGDVVMYGADWCGDCRRAKAYFAERNIDYEYVDLEARPDEVERVLERNDGVKRIPVIIFSDDSHLVEPSNAELDAKVRDLTETVATESEAAPVDDVVVEAIAVVDNADEARFELQIDGVLRSFGSYSIRGDSVVVPHVETVREFRGNGHAAQLMEGIVENLRVTDRKILPLCPYAAAYLRDRPETHDLIAS